MGNIKHDVLSEQEILEMFTEIDGEAFGEYKKRVAKAVYEKVNRIYEFKIAYIETLEKRKRDIEILITTLLDIKNAEIKLLREVLAINKKQNGKKEDGQ